MVIEGHLDTIFSLSVNFSRHMWRGKKHTTASLGFLVTYITFTFFSNTCRFILKMILRKIVKGTRDPNIEYLNLIECLINKLQNHHHKISPIFAKKENLVLTQL